MYFASFTCPEDLPPESQYLGILHMRYFFFKKKTQMWIVP